MPLPFAENISSWEAAFEISRAGKNRRRKLMSGKGRNPCGLRSSSRRMTQHPPDTQPALGPPQALLPAFRQRVLPNTSHAFSLTVAERLTSSKPPLRVLFRFYIRFLMILCTAVRINSSNTNLAMPSRFLKLFLTHLCPEDSVKAILSRGCDILRDLAPSSLVALHSPLPPTVSGRHRVVFRE